MRQIIITLESPEIKALEKEGEKSEIAKVNFFSWDMFFRVDGKLRKNTEFLAVSSYFRLRSKVFFDSLLKGRLKLLN